MLNFGGKREPVMMLYLGDVEEGIEGLVPSHEQGVVARESLKKLKQTVLLETMGGLNGIEEARGARLAYSYGGC
ncbi:hypothetical protein CK203_077500 [Vitis vinifera]|uniref:Uncharacterized protein n=1 Tax=Vitis vinifera TaxID=29760 RepID=A0A438DT35_VITVI|nr:hypothetical protein CK203_077500 [Vitis vinifera]